MANPVSVPDKTSTPEASRQDQGLFRNHAPVQREGVRKMLRIMWNMIFHKPSNTRPAAAIPVQPLTREDLLAAPNHSVFRLGHSTLLLKMQDKFWITDPVFAERAS
ncbi:MAG: hydrolase, partial [Pseudomonas sp.]